MHRWLWKPKFREPQLLLAPISSHCRTDDMRMSLTIGDYEFLCSNTWYDCCHETRWERLNVFVCASQLPLQSADQWVLPCWIPLNNHAAAMGVVC